MASDRPYHRGMSTKEIVDEIQLCRGTQFDPVIADIFVNLILKRGSSFVVNSARSVTQQYAASLLANASVTHNMFEWMLEKSSDGRCVVLENPSLATQPMEDDAFIVNHRGSGSPNPTGSRFRLSI
jgi:hypothetical protein